MSLRTRFALVYAALALILAGAAAGAYVGVTTMRRGGPPRCWVSAPDVPRALYSAAYCRFGRQNVLGLGWMPHIGRDGSPSRTLQEVVVERADRPSTYWLARVAPERSSFQVRQWTACGAVC
jgi:hypothetical protein